MGRRRVRCHLNERHSTASNTCQPLLSHAQQRLCAETKSYPSPVVQLKDLPLGIVSFVFTDIENSTRLVSTLGDAWVPTLERHFEIIRAAFESRGGLMLKTDGDARLDSALSEFKRQVEASLAT